VASGSKRRRMDPIRRPLSPAMARRASWSVSPDDDSDMEGEVEDRGTEAEEEEAEEEEVEAEEAEQEWEEMSEDSRALELAQLLKSFQGR
jgi:Mg-chelatase subunit ChlI